MMVVYKITYPNGKIYVGCDSYGSPRYFGSPNRTLLMSDFTFEQYSDFTVRRQVLWSLDAAPDNVEARKEMRTKEGEFIKALRSNDPAVGYNQSHRSRPPKQPK